MAKLPRQSILENALSFKHFMTRKKVLKQYRDFMRELKFLDPTVKQELRSEIRTGFSKNRHLTNSADINAAIADGASQLRMLQTYLARTHKKIDYTMNKEKYPHIKPIETDSEDAVGQGWPWETSSYEENLKKTPLK